MTQKDKNNLQAMEIWLWRKMTKTNWMKRKSNERGLKEIGEKRSIMINIMERTIKFIGHIIRHNNFLNNIFEGKIMGRRPRRRPRANYFHDI